MVARITTAALQGIDVQPVDVQAHMASGLPAFTMVGPNKPNANWVTSSKAKLMSNAWIGGLRK